MSPTLALVLEKEERRSLTLNPQADESREGLLGNPSENPSMDMGLVIELHIKMFTGRGWRQGPLRDER